jgi:aerobic-type carbon monoxide dehydrogenase small subunit (CoxS/CutS family)
MTTNDENHEQGGWQPVPQGGDYDSEATAFVQLPKYPEDMDWAGPAGSPLAAPGHGYVPPMILPLTPAAGTDPGATGAWTVPLVPSASQWPEPARDQGQDHGQDRQQVTGQWNFGEQQHEPQQHERQQEQRHEPQHDQQHDQRREPQHEQQPEPRPTASDLTGQWTIPVAQGDIPEDSSEFTMSALRGPATLPGGATAPWAVQNPAAGDFDPPLPAQASLPDYASHQAPATLPGGAPAPWALPDDGGAAAGEATHEEVRDPGAGFVLVREEREEGDEAAEPQESGHEAADAAESAPDAAQTPDPGQEPATGPEPDAEPGFDAEPDTDAASDAGIDPDADPAASPRSEHTPASYVLRVNGADRPVTDAWIGESLLYVLRERLGLAGAKDGCSQGECGACNVQVDGRLVASCLVPAATAAGSEVRTVEGLASDGEPSDVQRALAKCGAVQCGFCIPGMAMTVHDLLEGNHAPTELETRQALCGNLCRCSGYRGVLDAVAEVVSGREAAAAGAEEARIPHQAPPGAGSVQQQQPHLRDGGMA